MAIKGVSYSNGKYSLVISSFMKKVLKDGYYLFEKNVAKYDVMNLREI